MPVDPDSLPRNLLMERDASAICHVVTQRLRCPCCYAFRIQREGSALVGRAKAIPILDNEYPRREIRASIFSDSFLRSRFRPALILHSVAPTSLARTTTLPGRRRRENRAEISGGRAQVRAAGRSAICTAIYYPGECITSYRAGWMAFTIRGILCATHTWPHIPRHGRRYLHPAETRPQNRRENMLKDFSRECQALLPELSSSLSAPPHYRERL